MKNTIKHLSNQLKNVGPRLAEKLIEAGIDTPEKLRNLSAKQAFYRMPDLKKILHNLVPADSKKDQI